MNKPGPIVTALVVVVLTLVWGCTWAAIRIGLESVPPFTGAALRFLVAAVALFLVAAFLRVRHGTTPTERKLWVSVTLFSFVGSYAIVYYCEQYIPSGLASVLFATFPLATALLAHLFLPGERLTGGRLLGILLGFSGVAVIYSEDLSALGGSEVTRAAAIMLFAPLCAAINQTFVKRWGKGINPFALTSTPMAMAALILAGMALLLERGQPVDLTPTAVTTILYLGLFGSALTFTLYYWLLSFYSSTKLALVAFGTPVVAVSVGAIFLDEAWTARTVVGSVLVVIGVAVATLRR